MYDVVVIGAGTAGLVTAAGIAGLGGRAALVESARMGGDCLNTGCVPSKALIASARAAWRMREAGRWALPPHQPVPRFEDVMERVRERRARIAPHDSQERFESLGVDVVRGHARFVSPREVEVDGRHLRARHFVIATGSRPALPPVEGLAEARPHTNETVFDGLRARPARMAVIGGGPVGCELGQAFARLGVAVTLIESSARLLEKEDADAAALVLAGLEADGVRVLTGARLDRVREEGGVARLEVEAAGGREELVVEAVLVAVGRVPNVEDLGLDAAGVAHDRRGVSVNAYLQTSQPHIYAAGDVAGSYQFTHLADHHARTIVRNIVFPWWKARTDTTVLPWCTFTSPEVARVGVNEDAARRDGIAYDAWTVPLNELDRAVVDGEEDGFLKVLTARGRDRILGATLVAPHAGDLVHEIALAMTAGVGLKALSGMIHAYPTYAEAARRAGDRYQRSRFTPAARRLTEWLFRIRRGGRA